MSADQGPGPVGPGGAFRAMDLGVLGGAIPLVGAEAEAAIAQLERRSGYRCGGCKRRITVGFEFARFVAVQEEGQKVARVQREWACARDDCGYAERVAVGAAVMEPIKRMWLDEEGIREQVNAMLAERKEGPDGG